MKQANSFNFRKVLATTAMLLGAMVATVPVYAQQDVDPTWYNPWTPPAAAAVQKAQPQVAAQKKQAKVKVAAQKTATQREAKARVKRTSSTARPS